MSNVSDKHDPDVRKVIAGLIRAAKELNACGDGIRQSIETIQQSCNTPGTRGAAYRDVLVNKAKALKNLAVLCSKASGRLSEYSQRLNGDGSLDHVLEELLGFSQFLADQVRSEQEDALRILGLLRPGSEGSGDYSAVA